MNDFLDILRILNKDNVNKDPKLRDAFFKSLIACSENIPDYLPVLSDALYNGYKNEHKGKDPMLVNCILSDIFCNEIARQLTDNTIKDATDCLYIDRRAAAHAVTYTGSVKGIKKIIENTLQHFDFFKERLLMGLITRYSKETARSENIPERLNKLVGIYAEHIRKLEISKDIPMIIDEKFMNELNELPFVNSKECWRVVHNLIDRAFPRIQKQYIGKDEYFHQTENGIKEERTQRRK